MERIRLTKNEKKILLWANTHQGHLRPITFPQDEFNLACYQLEAKNLVRCGKVEGDDVEALRLTPYGRGYLMQNPTLRNPINWDRILIVISIVIGLIGLFTGCVAYAKMM